MTLVRTLLCSVFLPACVLGCSATPTDDAPGDNGTGGTTSTGGAGGTGGGGSGTSPTGGSGGTPSTGGAGGAIATGGSAGTLSTGGSAGTLSTGGSAGTLSTGGSAGTLSTGGSAGTLSTGGSGGGMIGGAGGSGGSGGKASGGLGGKAGGGSGGKASGGAAGSGTGGSGGSSVDCNAMMPTGGTTRSSSNASGTAAGLAWTVWTNAGPGSITYFNTPAFSASWNNSGDFLARLGLQWNATRTYDQYGIITAHFASRKTGTAGGYSYVGIYGWSVSPCVEYYIVDDSYNRMPVNPGNTTNKGTATIDGGTYTLYTRNTTGTGGSKCPSVTSWVQFYSVRQTARTCGQISITEHFNAWAAAGMTLGRMDQAQIFVEAGGGTGSIEFPVANVTATMN